MELLQGSGNFRKNYRKGNQLIGLFFFFFTVNYDFSWEMCERWGLTLETSRHRVYQAHMKVFEKGGAIQGRENLSGAPDNL